MTPILCLLPQEVYYRKRTHLVDFIGNVEDNENNKNNVFAWLYIAYCRLRDKPYRFKFETEELFNDTAALCTMVLHDDDMPAEHYWDYYDTIRAKARWIYQAKLTMWLAYGLLSLIEPNSRKINGFLQAIDNKYNSADELAVYREVVLDYIAKAKAIGIHATPDDFPLQLLPPREDIELWNNIEWNKVTQDFQTEQIEQLLSLWEEGNDKLLILKRIYAAFLEEEQRRLKEEIALDELPF